jgi:hypothetical protein
MVTEAADLLLQVLGDCVLEPPRRAFVDAELRKPVPASSEEFSA